MSDNRGSKTNRGRLPSTGKPIPLGFGEGVSSGANLSASKEKPKHSRPARNYESTEGEYLSGQTINVRPLWRRSPANNRGLPPAALMTDGEIIDALNAYFNIQYDNNRPVSYCDMAGAAGFDSITQLLNTARRRGGPVMRAISRCFLAVGAEYEDGGREGSKTALAMLSKLAEFDSQEDKSQAPSLPFSPRHELTLNVKGVQQEDNTLRNLTPQQAYIRVIRAKSIEEIPIQVSEEDDDSEVRVLDIEIDRF